MQQGGGLGAALLGVAQLEVSLCVGDQLLSHHRGLLRSLLTVTGLGLGEEGGRGVGYLSTGSIILLTPILQTTSNVMQCSHHTGHDDHVSVHGLGAPLLRARSLGGLPLLSQRPNRLVRLDHVSIKPAGRQPSQPPSCNVIAEHCLGWMKATQVRHEHDIGAMVFKTHSL